MTERITSFPPIVGPAPRLLILGTLPGVASLAAGQYYAHPRNAFWSIVSAVTGIAADAPYTERVAGLQTAGIALWDVLASGVRPGSLDADIVPASMQPNAIGELLEAHPSIRAVCFNGQGAETLFRRHIAPTLGERALAYHRLPSTSPAHASLSRAEKAARWLAVIGSSTAISR